MRREHFKASNIIGQIAILVFEFSLPHAPDLSYAVNIALKLELIVAAYHSDRRITKRLSKTNTTWTPRSTHTILADPLYEQRREVAKATIFCGLISTFSATTSD